MKPSLQKEVIPLYSRIASTLRNRITSGQYEPGGKLLSEEGFVQHFGVSRITVRKALSQLEMEGLIVRNRGRGTFVSQTIPAKKQSIYTSVRDIVLSIERSEIKPLGIQKVKVGQTRVAHDIRAFFGLSNADEIAQIRRVLLRKGTPLRFFENFMPLGIAKHITLKDIAEKKAIIKILQEKMDLKIGRGEMYLEAIPADPDIAKILRCQVFDSFVRAQVFFWLPSDEPFEIVNYFIRADNFKYKIDIDTNDFENSTLDI